MQDYLSKCSILIILPLFLLLPPIPAKAVDKVVFSGGAPLDTYQPRVIVPILTEAFRRNGIEFEAQYHPSLRSLMYANSGIIDGELHRVYEFHEISDEKYPNLIRIESKLLSIWLSAFSSKVKKIEKWEDLKDYKIVYYRGRKNVEKYLKTYTSFEQTSTASTDRQAFQMLAAGRVDVVISESLAGRQIIENNSKYGNIKEIAKLKETEIYSYIHKKHKDLARIIAHTIEEMKQDGTFGRIVENGITAQK